MLVVISFPSLPSFFRLFSLGLLCSISHLDLALVFSSICALKELSKDINFGNHTPHQVESNIWTFHVPFFMIKCGILICLLLLFTLRISSEANIKNYAIKILKKLENFSLQEFFPLVSISRLKFLDVKLKHNKSF